jgi:hypothetical protein
MRTRDFENDVPLASQLGVALVLEPELAVL